MTNGDASRIAEIRDQIEVLKNHIARLDRFAPLLARCGGPMMLMRQTVSPGGPGVALLSPPPSGGHELPCGRGVSTPSSRPRGHLPVRWVFRACHSPASHCRGVYAPLRRVDSITAAAAPPNTLPCNVSAGHTLGVVRAWRLLAARHSLDRHAEQMVLDERGDCPQCLRDTALAAIDAAD